MSELTPIQRHLAELLFSLPEADGYALAGGAALILCRVVERSTQDLDAFIGARPGPDPGTVDRLADAFSASAERKGWTTKVARRHPTFCRFLLGRDGETVELDLAVDSPSLEPLQFVDGIPVLGALDLAARKVLAIVDRLEARDYTDLQALALLVGRRACVDAALSMDAGLRTSHVAGAFERISRLADERYPAATADPASTRSYFLSWASEVSRPRSA